jgi:hypothetical protein
MAPALHLLEKIGGLRNEDQGKYHNPGEPAAPDAALVASFKPGSGGGKKKGPLCNSQAVS